MSWERSTQVAKKAVNHRGVGLLLIGILLGLIPAQAAHADTISVCDSGCDFTTIQAAVDDPSTVAGDVIQVFDAVHVEQGIAVTKDVTIQGQGAGSTTVEAHETPGSATDRVFHVAGGVSVTIKDVTIRHGNPTECPMYGGGITNEGVLTLENVVVSDNTAKSGGGIVNQGKLTLVNCTVRDNASTGVGKRRGSGGGIKSMGGQLTILDSTICGNSAAGRGGGIKLCCNSTLDLINSTISGNDAQREGGGIHIRGVVTITHSTISDNSASAGGGVLVRGNSDHTLGILDITNTIVANNVAGGDCTVGDEGTIGANANNLVGDGSCSPAYAGDPKLAPLANNGGATWTHALLPGSPAIDAIPAKSCTLTADQRGESRPAGRALAAPRCDVGAFERQADTTPSTNLLAAGGLAAALLILAIAGLAIRRRRRTAG